MNFSKNIATLRKTNNLTQEELGIKLGVSAQSISKWENSISMPDICLLPMIAETLGVTIDGLFGIDTNISISKGDDFPKKIHDQILDDICSWFEIKEAHTEYKKHLEKDENTACVIYTKSGAVFEDRDIGIVYPKSAKDAQSLLDDDKALELISVLGTSAILKTLNYLVKTKQFATVALISNKCSLNESEVHNALEQLKKYKLINNQTISLEDECVEVWHIYRTHVLFFVYAILQLAKRISIPEDNYFCYHGNDCWCY